MASGSSSLKFGPLPILKKGDKTTQKYSINPMGKNIIIQSDPKITISVNRSDIPESLTNMILIYNAGNQTVEDKLNLEKINNPDIHVELPHSSISQFLRRTLSITPKGNLHMDVEKSPNNLLAF